VLRFVMLQLRYYLTAGGESPFESWFSDLDAAAAAKVSVALVRLEQGNTSNAKGVGGVLEYVCNNNYCVNLSGDRLHSPSAESNMGSTQRNAETEASARSAAAGDLHVMVALRSGTE
jgi:hypothetical protein